MIIEHIAIWTLDLEKMRSFYIQFFGAKSNQKYLNPAKSFQSYFLSFDTGCRLELMQMPGMEEQGKSPGSPSQHFGIAHIAFGVKNKMEVDLKAKELAEAGYPILTGPRVTGDGYYEFETVDPEDNRLEISTAYTAAQDV